MRQTLILLAGFPGTGKTYLANLIVDSHPYFNLCSIDEMKECYWDQYGFHNEDEKESLIQLSWKAYYQKLDSLLKKGKYLISDYPFSNKQKKQLEEIAQRNDVQIITIRLVGDLNVLFQRLSERDLHSHRHLGHIVTSYYKGMEVGHQQADNLLTYDEFVRRCTTRGYESFALGKTIELDVSDFADVDYDEVLLFVKQTVNG